MIEATNHLTFDNSQKNKPLNLQNFTCHLLENKHVDEALDVFCKAFSLAEPMTYYLGISYEEFKVFGERVVNKAVADKISVVAMDKNNIAALALSEDLMNPLQLDFQFDPRFNIIFTLLESLGATFFRGKTFSSNHIAHLFITAVNEKYRGHGLSKFINFKAMEIAANNHFDFMYCEFTNHLNEHGTVRHITLPKRLIGSIEYDNFIYEDKKPFAQLSHGAKSYLWQIKPDKKLRFISEGKEIILDL